MFWQPLPLLLDTRMGSATVAVPSAVPTLGCTLCGSGEPLIVTDGGAPVNAAPLRVRLESAEQPDGSVVTITVTWVTVSCTACGLSSVSARVEDTPGARLDTVPDTEKSLPDASTAPG